MRGSDAEAARFFVNYLHPDPILGAAGSFDVGAVHEAHLDRTP